MTDIVIMAAISGTVAVIGTLPATISSLAAYRAARDAKDHASAAEKQAKINTDATAAVQDKVDGNYSDLKGEVAAAKAEVAVANQRIAVLIERLITSTPAAAAPVIQINGSSDKH